jgi:hypothetical protein
MAQLLSNEDEVLEAFDPSIAATRRFKYVSTGSKGEWQRDSCFSLERITFESETIDRLWMFPESDAKPSSIDHVFCFSTGILLLSSFTWPFDRWRSLLTSCVRGLKQVSSLHSWSSSFCFRWISGQWKISPGVFSLAFVTGIMSTMLGITTGYSNREKLEHRSLPCSL